MLLWVLLLALGSSTLAKSVTTSFGNIVGHPASTSDGHGCEEFLGIPFAEKPERFASPLPWKTHYGPEGLVASKYGPWCPQMDGERADGDEDCLFLNVWRPTGTLPRQNLTVMVWIYGGSFTMGDDGDSNSPNTYDGCGLAARHGVIIAGMNYRLGPLGFAALVNPSGGVDANWGFQDQREAMRWLQQEVPGFGGSSEKVTIFGESAGAQSVWHHLASPRSVGMFRAAISESGMPGAVSSKYALNKTVDFASLMGCKQKDSASLRACLMSKSAADLIMTAASEPGDPEAYWAPTVDGVELVDYPDVMLRQNRTHAVPILAGINTNEGTCFIYPAYPDGMNVSQYHSFLTSTLTTKERGLTDMDMAKVLRAYPPGDTKDLRALASGLFTDIFLCRNMNAIKSLSTRVDTFVYRFNHRPTCPVPSSAPGVYHGVEMPYVFGTPKTYECSFTDAEQALSTRMQLMWTSFAKDLNPSYRYEDFENIKDAGFVGESFPKYDGDSRMGVVLQTPSDTTEHAYRASFCKVWDDIWDSKHADYTLAFV